MICRWIGKEFKKVFIICFLEIKSFNFQQIKKENSTSTKTRRSTVNAYVSSDVTYDLDDIVGFSFLIRTRQPNSLIALLLSQKPNPSGSANVNYLLVEVQDGNLNVTSVTKDGRPVTNSSLVRIDNGKWMEIRITKKFIEINNSKTSVNLNPLNIRHVFMGGVDNPSLYENILGVKDEFDGCLQAVKLGNSYLTSETIPDLATTGVLMSATVRSDVCKGDDVCGSSPCLFNSTCHDIWNDFTCTCPMNFQGKTCADYGCRVNHTCSSDFACFDIEDQPGKIRCKYCCNYFYIVSLMSVYNLLK